MADGSRHGRRAAGRGGRRAPAAVQRLARRVGDGAGAAREVGARVVEGDRPLVAGLLGLVALSVVMVSGPLQSFFDGRERVELLERKEDALQTEIDRLEQRREDLNDPEKLELLAREEQGFVRPGEVPYAVVPPEADEPRIEGPQDVAEPDEPWYRRLWDTVADVFR